nr:transposase [Micromonospora zingiberis]
MAWRTPQRARVSADSPERQVGHHQHNGSRESRSWWPQLSVSATQITNAGSEGTNRVIETIAHDAYGFRNPDNQRLRTGGRLRSGLGMARRMGRRTRGGLRSGRTPGFPPGQERSRRA